MEFLFDFLSLFHVSGPFYLSIFVVFNILLNFFGTFYFSDQIFNFQIIFLNIFFSASCIVCFLQVPFLVVSDVVSFLKNIYLYWSTADLQCCVSFRCAAK